MTSRSIECWAIGGPCPDIALVQLGEEQLGAAVTLLGMLAGNCGDQ